MVSHLAFLSLSVAVTTAMLSQGVVASSFIEDSNATLLLRNYYFDRDYKNESVPPAQREWAQGFILKYNSGYTEGTLGFGLDAQAFHGMKLDSAPDRAGTGLLPLHADGHAANEYSELGLTAKFKLSKTELLLGTQYPMLPIALTPYSRLFPQTFHGGSIRSGEIDRLTLHVGKFDQVNLRDSTDYESMGVASPNSRFNRTARSNDFRYVGGIYDWSPNLALKYFNSELQDLFEQQYLGFIYKLPLGPGKLKADFRYFDSREHGSAKAGVVDNRNLNLILTYSQGAHSFGAGVMRLSGDSAMPYIAGGDPDVMSEGLLSSDFVNPNEKVGQVRYDYDFVGLGLPGLTGTLRYVKGSDIELPGRLGGNDRQESERQIALAYVVQSGSLKGVALRLRHAWYRNNFASTANFRDDNELRVNIEYAFGLF